MKRIHILLIGFALCAAVAVGYSDSNVIQKDSIQVNDELVQNDIQQVELTAELFDVVLLDAPHLGSPASNYNLVSEELTDVMKMRIRPPPEKVQKSGYKELFS